MNIITSREKGSQSAEERLKKYVHEFLMSGKEVQEIRTQKYSLIDDALNDEVYDAEEDEHFVRIDVKGMFAKTLGIDTDDIYSEETEKKEVVDWKLEQDYRLAQDDEIAEFYFQHFKQIRNKIYS